MTLGLPYDTWEFSLNLFVGHERTTRSVFAGRLKLDFPV